MPSLLMYVPVTGQPIQLIYIDCVSAPECLIQAPKHRYALGIFPTPLHRWHPPGLPDNVEMYIKRDDLSGMQLSGNKVRLQVVAFCLPLYL